LVMSSNYNARPRPAAVMVDGAGYHVVRNRETTAELFAHEKMLP
ncbi:MAG: diaminopimelate decarboxylase, partial [Acidiferrobacteraceae bacterium]|nr:diaminopimelate decarboxylase [Acidiferrobacteraceae bacterium]